MNNRKYLMSVLNYDKITGLFTWKTKVSRKIVPGQITGCPRANNGYLRIGINGKTYYAHRLAWLFVYGYFPEHQIDHINRDRTDNRIKNLREATQSCNSRNCKTPKNNSSGVKGVFFDKVNRKWVAVIRAKGKNRYLGRYKHLANAVCARLAGEQALGWNGCDSSSPAFLYVKSMQKNIMKGV